MHPMPQNLNRDLCSWYVQRHKYLEYSYLEELSMDLLKESLRALKSICEFKNYVIFTYR